MAAKLSTREAIYKVLTASGKPMKVPDIIKAGVPMTNLSGKTPGQTFYSVLYAEAKKPKGVFQRVAKGSFKVRAGMTLEHKPQAKPDPKPGKRAPAKRAPAKRAPAKRAPAKTTAARSRRSARRSGRA